MLLLDGQPPALVFEKTLNTINNDIALTRQGQLAAAAVLRRPSTEEALP